MDVNEVNLSKPKSDAEKAKHRGRVCASYPSTEALKHSVKDYIAPGARGLKGSWMGTTAKY